MKKVYFTYFNYSLALPDVHTGQLTDKPTCRLPSWGAGDSKLKQQNTHHKMFAHIQGIYYSVIQHPQVERTANRLIHEVAYQQVVHLTVPEIHFVKNEEQQ